MKDKFFWRIINAVQGQGSGNWRLPILFSAVLHTVLLIGLFMVMPSSSETRTINPSPSFVSARVVTLEQAKPKPKPKPAPRVAPEPRPKPKAQPKPAPRQPVKKPPPKPKVDQKAIALKRKQEEERKQREKAAAERERQRKEQERLDQLQKQREQEMLAAMAREQQARQQAAQLKADQAEVASYTQVIASLVSSRWSRPASARRGMTVVLRIRLAPTGEVISIAKVRGSGDEAFDRSAQQAVNSAAPFREIRNIESRIFEKNFREFTFLFNPEDLLK
ncbi:cell envelope integrity protein TolA [Sansalvadorimonas verongulae]|uniref:cell envelope integrity protein TolA n=1 Tax=Sansalvadorimonas verongulae TaxID=2172824 RepID=UPI0012BD28B5|nr:cell envelope integrity protein TolA [Sansalvadorimonas verongulae]MTI13753.1 cell envelope integrity protein TolA [Sansalvadorimonas verongulae]